MAAIGIAIVQENKLGNSIAIIEESSKSQKIVGTELIKKIK